MFLADVRNHPLGEKITICQGRGQLNFEGGRRQFIGTLPLRTCALKYLIEAASYTDDGIPCGAVSFSSTGCGCRYMISLFAVHSFHEIE